MLLLKGPRAHVTGMSEKNGENQHRMQSLKISSVEGFNGRVCIYIFICTHTHFFKGFCFSVLGSFPCYLLHFGAKIFDLWLVCYLQHFGVKISHLHAHLAFGFWLWLLAFVGVWLWFHLAFGFWLLAFGVWPLALLGFWLLAVGFAWLLAFGFWPLASLGLWLLLVFVFCLQVVSCHRHS